MGNVQQAPGFIAAIVVTIGVVALAALTVWRVVRDLRRARAAREALAARELVIIDENIRATPVGALSILMMFAVLIGFGWVSLKAATVFQQIEAGVEMTGGLVLFGLGAALGRRRRYVVYRSEQREPL